MTRTEEIRGTMVMDGHFFVNGHHLDSKLVRINSSLHELRLIYNLPIFKIVCKKKVTFFETNYEKYQFTFASFACRAN